MPVDPNHEYVDKPHEKTVHLPSQGWRYGCNSGRTGSTTARGGWTQYIAHPWAKHGMEPIATTWLQKPCGHSERGSDAACEGCINRGDT